MSRPINSLALLALLSLPLQGISQTRERAAVYLDLAVGAGPSFFQSALTGARLHPIGKTGRWKLGYGLRITTAAARDADFITAPALLTSGQEGPHVIFLETKEENLDTLTVRSAALSFVNLAFFAEYGLSKRWGLGLNIDVVGFSFGSEVDGIFRSSLASPNATIQRASPSRWNLLLGSDSDVGSLNSEFYATYLLNSRWTLRAGAGFTFSELTTQRELTFENDRFRLKSLAFTVAARFRLNP